jgi:hypothetical protein
MKLRVTSAPFQSSRDGRWYVVAEHGHMIEHVRLNERGDDAPAVLGRVFGMTPLLAAKVANNPGTWVTYKPRAVKPPGLNRQVLDALEKATTKRKVKK